MQNIRVNVKLRGVAPLLMNRMPEDKLLQLFFKDKKQTTAQGRPATPRDEAKPKVYADATGPYLPAQNLMSCFIAAGVFMKLDGKRQISTATSSVLGGMLTIEQNKLYLLDADDKPATWEVDVQQGRNPNGGEAVCIIRPRFDEWRTSFSMLVDLAQLPEVRYRELFDIAGTRCGLGDFRPNKKGTFGRFTADAWVAESLDAAAE